MVEVSNFLVGVVASIIATVIASLAWWAWTAYRNMDYLWSLVGLNSNLESWVCYGNVQKERILGAAMEDGQRDYTTFEYGDIAAVLLIYDRLKTSQRAKVRHAVCADLDLPAGGNIFSIGGPKWNRATEELIGRMGSPLYFEPGVGGIVEKRKSHTTANIYSGESQREGCGSLSITDYGFIVCGRLNYVSNQIATAVVIAGHTTYGVLLASEFLCRMTRSDVRWLKRRLRGDKRFALLVEGTVSLIPGGRLTIRDGPRLLAWLPEQDFAEAYSYNYGAEIPEGPTPTTGSAEGSE